MRTATRMSVVVLVCWLRGNAATLTVDLNGGADYTDIQSAIDAAKDGDAVLVQPGEYIVTETLNFNRGHVPGAEDPAAPPPKDLTLRSAEGPERTTIRLDDVPGIGRAVVGFWSGETGASVLEGFTLADGAAGGFPAAENGGGLFCSASSPTVRNCVIKGTNGFASGNGAIFCGGGSPLFVGCSVTDNESFGAYVFRSSPTFVSCSFVGNAGVGLHCYEATLNLERCRFERNRGQGIGIDVSSRSLPTIVDCDIIENSGDGVWLGFEVVGTMRGCRIERNVGAAIRGEDDPTVAIESCTIVENEAAGLEVDDLSSFALTNCTIAGNAYGLTVYSGPAVSLKNCIVWDNAGGSVSPTSRPDGLVIAYSCIAGDPVWTGEGNMNSDPLFVRPGEWVACGSAGQCRVYDCHLQPASPAIDAGTLDGAPTTDIEGHGRPCGTGVDVGAYEFGDCLPAPAFVRGDSNADGTFDISDPVATLIYLFLGISAPPCLDAADTDGNSTLEITDAIHGLDFLFTSGPAPASPFPDCGRELVIDALDCQEYPGCR